VNFALCATSEVLARVAKDLVDGRVVPPPITRIALEEVPSVIHARPDHHADGKTVIAL
jgi:hypothetical protein